MTSKVPQRKRLAMGESVTGVRFRTGGLVPSTSTKTGIPDTPLEKIKRANGIVGMKKGGKVK